MMPMTFLFLPKIGILLVVNQSGNLLDITLPDGTATRVPGLPLELGGRRTQIRRDLPNIGEHGVEILKEAGFSEAEIAAMLDAGSVLRSDTPD